MGTLKEVWVRGYRVDVKVDVVSKHWPHGMLP